MFADEVLFDFYSQYNRLKNIFSSFACSSRILRGVIPNGMGTISLDSKVHKKCFEFWVFVDVLLHKPQKVAQVFVKL